MTNTSFWAFGLGIGTQDNKGNWLELFYTAPLLNPDPIITDTVLQTLGAEGGGEDNPLNTEQLQTLANAFETVGANTQAQLANTLVQSKAPVTVCLVKDDVAPTSVPQVYLKLHLLSHRLLAPHEADLTGMFGLLPNVAWTSDGAIALEELAQRQLQARVEGRLLEVMSVDKFPKMTNYVVPSGVRIADTDRVRLGAYLGEGTTVMHEGFVNFNAGTLGTSMVEGRISAGVVVGNGSDLGGGCSTMGTLSGGGNMVISVGEECLIGANAGLGLPLGDRCTIEAGLYITSGSKVTVLDKNNEAVETIKARELAGKTDLLFRRNSESGRIECKTNQTAIALNEELHANN